MTNNPDAHGKNNHKQPKPVKVTEIRFHKNIAEHDLNTKIRKIEQELSKKHQVKLRLQLIGREKGKPQEAIAWLQNVAQNFNQIATTNRTPTPDNLTITLFPKKVH